MDGNRFKEGMTRLGAAVSLIATDGPAGRAGLTATAVCSVTDQPPTLLVCVNRASRSLEAIKANGVIGVNILRQCHDGLAMRFSSGALSQKERFDGVEWAKGPTGAPLLADAMASFDCRISQISDVGSHCVLFCVVEHIEFHDDKNGLFYFDRSFRQLAGNSL